MRRRRCRIAANYKDVIVLSLSLHGRRRANCHSPVNSLMKVAVSNDCNSSEKMIGFQSSEEHGSRPLYLFFLINNSQLKIKIVIKYSMVESRDQIEGWVVRTQNIVLLEELEQERGEREDKSVM